MVDNCYGEFVETIRPSDVGADMCVGSPHQKIQAADLPPSGGYIAGRKDCVEKSSVSSDSTGTWQGTGQNLGEPFLYQGFSWHSGNGFCTEISYLFAANIYESLPV